MREFLSGCAAAAGRRYRSWLVRSAAAAAFLRAHRGHVLLIIIDIGANNLEDCGSRPDLAALASCVGHSRDHHALAAILSSLRAAAGLGAPIVGMT